MVLSLEFLGSFLLILTFEEGFGVLPPGSEVVLVEDHQVPVDSVNPLVLGLDQAGLLVPSEEVLERAEVDQRLICLDFATLIEGFRAQVLPAFKVHVACQVFTPGVLDGRFEGHHQHAFGAHAFGELVGGEGLAEAHLRVPQEARDRTRIFFPDGVVIGKSLFDSTGLLGAHREGLVALARVLHPGAQFRDSSEHISRLAAHPLGR